MRSRDHLCTCAEEGLPTGHPHCCFQVKADAEWRALRSCGMMGNEHDLDGKGHGCPGEAKTQAAGHPTAALQNWPLRAPCGSQGKQPAAIYLPPKLPKRKASDYNLSLWTRILAERSKHKQPNNDLAGIHRNHLVTWASLSLCSLPPQPSPTQRPSPGAIAWWFKDTHGTEFKYTVLSLELQKVARHQV